MSDLSTLASNFESESKQQAENTRQRVESALNAHEAALKKCLDKERKRIEAAIRDQSQQLQRTALKSWMFVAIPVAIMLLLAGAGSWALGWYIQSQAVQISEHRETLATLREKGGAITIIQCGPEKRLCAAIDPDVPKFTNDKGQTFRVLEGY